jgi:hypothetical protein
MGYLMLNVIESLPDNLLSLPAPELHTVLPGPTLIHLRGRKNPAVFVCVLLHGNEHTGWDAVRKLLGEYSGKELPRSLSVFIGNIEAARYNKRFLEGQPDFNRIWNGGNSSEQKMMRQVRDEMKNCGVYISIDVHNNTGKNPHYACVNKTQNEFLQVATLFSRTVVYFIRPEGVQSMTFSDFCPAVTVECGTSGATSGTEHACEFIDACLHLSEIPTHAVEIHDLDLYHTVAVVKIPEKYSFGFDQAKNDLQFDEKIEYYNFRELPEGTVIASVRNGIKQPLDIRNEQGAQVSNEYFSADNGIIRSRKQIIPAMITLNTEIIRKDCLCYLMEHYQLP